MPTGHPKMNQQRTSKIKQERVVPTGHPKMNQQRTSKIIQERVVPTGHPKMNQQDQTGEGSAHRPPQDQPKLLTALKGIFFRKQILEDIFLFF